MIKDDDIFLGHMLEYAWLVTKTIVDWLRRGEYEVENGM